MHPSKRLSVKCPPEQASESWASWNHRPKSVGLGDPGYVCNVSGSLRPCSYDGSQFECYCLKVVENDIWMVVAPGLITCSDGPVEMID
jgi:hypothetical protein